MKSSYELAMERLAKQSPSVSLSAKQKARLAELDSIYKAKVAGREIALRGEIERSMEGGDVEAATQLDQRLASERKALEAERDEKKERVRKGG